MPCRGSVTLLELVARIAKKTRTATSGPVITKLIFAKPINSKAVTGQTTQVSPVIAGCTYLTCFALQFF
uniref:Uncharacterized protein n=1 Tax=Pavo cristatus TaxID=9049 RepID=A0A8C9F1T1_PAVCR